MEKKPQNLNLDEAYTNSAIITGTTLGVTVLGVACVPLGIAAAGLTVLFAGVAYQHKPNLVDPKTVQEGFKIVRDDLKKKLSRKPD